MTESADLGDVINDEEPEQEPDAPREDEGQGSFSSIKENLSLQF